MELVDSPNEDWENLNVSYVFQSMELLNYSPEGFITNRGFDEGLYDVHVRQNDWSSQGKESRVQSYLHHTPLKPLDSVRINDSMPIN
ncbi:hypothetical protein T265_03562 [Opisthorchis viverrini]|uniref:Uncharacterized protein n=1 Tax=Opisthorchis viverrini TaxID=6198 RepID=A0A074ZR23_OPIVI|nr:hypothetical protein T265_03562 [Opisthorchis viverrini]KER29863.1 hypothetical protein T265_03562 [Opisthorchis viverrini]